MATDRITLIVTVISFITVYMLNAQTDSLPEILFESQEEENNINEWLETFCAHPVDINSASKEIIENIPFLSDKQIDLILKFRPFNTKKDVRSLIGKDTYNYIRHFIIVKKTKYIPIVVLSQRLQYTIEKNRAISESIFIGTPFESYSRVRLNLSSSISSGILMQKDIGERSLIDHLSGFLSWYDSNFPVKAIIGNYYIRYAEGLLLSAPFTLPKSAIILNPLHHRYITAKPFLSSNESDGFLGGALEIETGKGSTLIAFYSKILRDALFSDDKSGIINFDRSGYHRTNTELLGENTLHEKSYGGVLSYSGLFFNRLGLAYIKTEYTPSIVAPSYKERRNNYFRFSGSSISNFSFYYSVKIKTVNFSGEVVPFSSAKYAHQHTIGLNDNQWKLVIKWWHLPVNFQSPFCRVVSSSSPFSRGLQGFFIGSSGKPFADLQATIYWHHEKKLWRTFFQPLPTHNKDLFLQLIFSPAPKTDLLISYKFSNSQFYQSEVYRSIEKKKYNLRLQFEKRLSTKVRFRTRMEKTILYFSDVIPKKTGLNIYQEFNWKLSRIFNLHLRFSSFSTADYDSRLFEYESDLPGVFSNFALFGKGVKWYALFSINITQKIRTWFKYRKISFDGVQSIGSGITTIKGETRQDVRIQFEYKY